MQKPADPPDTPDLYDPRRSLVPPEALFVLTLRPLRSPVPAPVRLRGVLKRLLRSYAMRAVSVRQVAPEPAANCQRAGSPTTPSKTLPAKESKA